MNPLFYVTNSNRPNKIRFCHKIITIIKRRRRGRRRRRRRKTQNENRCNSSSIGFSSILPVGKKAVLITFPRALSVGFILQCRHRIYQILKEQFSNSNSFLLPFFEIHIISGHVDWLNLESWQAVKPPDFNFFELLNCRVRINFWGSRQPNISKRFPFLLRIKHWRISILCGNNMKRRKVKLHLLTS